MGEIMSKTLGIILAGGRSTRLFPATLVSTKQVLPIYDKPLIYYPLSTLMSAGIRDFVIISTPKELPIFQELFADAEETLGIRISFATQDEPRGIADAFNVVAEYMFPTELLEFDKFALILGDNIFYGSAMTDLLNDANCDGQDGAYIFATEVVDPERFGVVRINRRTGFPASIEEKPKKPKSNLAVTGLYFYPRDVFRVVKHMKPSERGELEITDLNRIYLEEGRLSVMQIARGTVWFDTGTPDALMEAATLVQNIQKHQGYMIGSPHEVAWQYSWITNEQLLKTADLCGKSSYGTYLRKVVEQHAQQNNN